jgi:hypothetical protein
MASAEIRSQDEHLPAVRLRRAVKLESRGRISMSEAWRGPEDDDRRYAASKLVKIAQRPIDLTARYPAKAARREVLGWQDALLDL